MAKISNLTRTQAQERAALLSIDHYDIHLDLTSTDATFHSITTVTFDADINKGTSTFIDIYAHTIHSATLNGHSIDISNFDTAHGLQLDNLQAHNELTVNAHMWYSHTGEGLHRFTDPVDQEVYRYTQFEPSDADRVFACFDQPDLKATFTLHITAPLQWTVISNSPLESQDGLTRNFAPTSKQSTYLVAIIAGPYASFHDNYHDEYTDIPLGIYARASLATYVDADKIFRETKQGFGFYHKNFQIAYPFKKYDQIFVPEFNAGAMENIGAVTFLEDYIFRSKVTHSRYEARCETILHEMAHMWFGDLVTMKWFEDLWLNESFATFASVLAQVTATDYSQAWTSFASTEKAWAYRQDALSSTHPIAADIPDVHAVEVNFDGITYAKGASVLKQLVAYVGLEKFLAGLRSYFHTYQYSNATFDNLLSALEKSSGRDLSTWGQQWLKTTGINSIEARFTIDTTGNYSLLSIKQGPALPGQGELRTHRIAIGIYDDDGSGAIVRTHQATVDISREETFIDDLIGVKAGLFVIPNDEDLTYAQLILDERSLHNATDRLGDIADPLAQTLLWSALWEATRNATYKARDYLTLIMRHSASMPVIGVLEKILANGAVALYHYADPQWVKNEGQTLYSTFLLDAAKNAPAGSDQQLAYFQAFIAGAITLSHHHDLLEQLLTDKSGDKCELPGLIIDTDLRWKIIIALARALRYDKAQIQTELDLDNTNSGARYAAKALASIPTPENKRETWDTLFHNQQLSNLLARWMCQGFTSPGQDEILHQYRDAYFMHICDQWENSSSPELSQTLAIYLYPQWSADTTSLEQSEKVINAPTTPASLKRLLIEGRDDTLRIIANRNYDARTTHELY